jgi:hypothetical protein
VSRYGSCEKNVIVGVAGMKKKKKNVGVVQRRGQPAARWFVRCDVARGPAGWACVGA